MNENLRWIQDRMPSSGAGRKVAASLVDVAKADWRRVIAERVAEWAALPGAENAEEWRDVD